jgi:hypothetical protein
VSTTSAARGAAGSSRTRGRLEATGTRNVHHRRGLRTSAGVEGRSSNAPVHMDPTARGHGPSYSTSPPRRPPPPRRQITSTVSPAASPSAAQSRH